MFLNCMMKLYIQLHLFFDRKEGATAIEYVILVAVIALVILSAGKTLGTNISSLFGKIGTAITSS